MTFMLPWLAKGGHECWTECVVLNPHHKGKKAKDYSLTFYNTEVLPSETIYNIARLAGSGHPQKGPSRWDKAGRAAWICSAKTPKLLDVSQPKGGRPRTEPKRLSSPEIAHPTPLAG